MNNRELDELYYSLSRLLNMLELSTNYVRAAMKALAQARDLSYKEIKPPEVNP